MKKISLIGIGAFVAAISLSACGVDPDTAKRALAAHGIRDAEIGGHAWFGCSDQDTFASVWTGMGADGKPVSGVICGGLLKGYTVRFD